MPKTSAEPSRLVNTSIRVPADLRAKYERVVKAANPEFDVSKAVRMHMREVVAAAEARENVNGRPATDARSSIQT